MKNEFTFLNLIKLNGYNSYSNEISKKNWIKYTNFFLRKYKIKSRENILDVGCGSGVFLIPYYKKKINCYGIDYSAPLIKICKKKMPNGNFLRIEASEIKKLKKNKFDYIFISSVLQYFPSTEYLRKVIEGIKLVSHINTKIFILDIPDIKKHNRWKKFVIKNYGIKEFYKKYTNLEHRAYNRNLLKKLFEKYNFKVKIEDQKLIKKANSKFRFNIFLERYED